MVRGSTYHTTNNAKARSIKMWVWYSSSGQNRSKKFHPSERDTELLGEWTLGWGVHQYWKTSHHVVFMKNRSKKTHNFEKLRERGAQVSLQLYGLCSAAIQEWGESRKKEITCQSLKSKSTHHLGADFKKPSWSSAHKERTPWPAWY